jgi:hypothetical protein
MIDVLMIWWRAGWIDGGHPLKALRSGLHLVLKSAHDLVLDLHTVETYIDQSALTIGTPITE